jgi:hypothetical protein
MTLSFSDSVKISNLEFNTKFNWFHNIIDLKTKTQKALNIKTCLYRMECRLRNFIKNIQNIQIPHKIKT